MSNSPVPDNEPDNDKGGDGRGDRLHIPLSFKDAVAGFLRVKPKREKADSELPKGDDEAADR